jgi:hypothetical protein
MNRELARKVADSVLYEGYMLYPYRPSAMKNRQRRCFGILYPPAYAEVIGGTEHSRMHSECLVQESVDAAIQIDLRFLHLHARQVFQRINDEFKPVPSLSIDGRLFESGDEGNDHSAVFNFRLKTGSRSFEFSFHGENRDVELSDSAGEVTGKVSQSHHEVRGTVALTAEQIRPNVWKLIVDVHNQTRLKADPQDRDAALLSSLLSAQLILTATGAEFVSLLDPPDDLKQAATACRNIGNFPVLLGSEGEHEMVLCSPILLYDYPQVAPESAGDFYDSTEMDEMLTLRVMTLTEEEKSQMRLAGDRTRNLLERTEATAREQLMRTHGTIRELRNIQEEVSEKLR